MAVSNGALTALKEASPYRLIFIACFVGLVFTNLLAGLFYYLAKMTDRDTQCFSICFKAYENPIVFLNIVLIFIMLLTMIEFWLNGDHSGIMLVLLGLFFMAVILYYCRGCIKKILP